MRAYVFFLLIRVDINIFPCLHLRMSLRLKVDYIGTDVEQSYVLTGNVAYLMKVAPLKAICVCSCSFVINLLSVAACDCHRLGSIRVDCEQMTGRCVCRANVVGLKCDRCQDGQLVDKVPGGCGGHGNGGTGSGSEDGLESESHHCSDLTCRFGAICQDLQGQAVCVCPMDCPVASSAEQTVCGSDGVSYGSECDLRLAACRKQLNVAMAYEGPCSDDIINTSAGMSPLMAESEAAVSKATRHVQETDVALLDWGRRDIVSLSQVGSQQANEYYGFTQPVWRPTASSVHVRGYLGESCVDDNQCQSVANSGCLFGVCSCSDGFAEDSDRRSCVGRFFFYFKFRALKI